MSREGFVVRFVAGICTEFSVSVDFIRKAGMTQLMTKIIYGISAIDPVTFVGVAIARTSILLAIRRFRAAKAKFSSGTLRNNLRIFSTFNDSRRTCMLDLQISIRRIRVWFSGKVMLGR